MSELQDLLTGLRANGVQLWVRHGQLRYRAPRDLTPAQIADLRQRKAEIIALLEAPAASAATSLPLGGAPRPSVIPLSYAQEGLWFLDQLKLLGPAYNIRSIVRIEGALDTPALTRALHELVRRHEILRTRFRAQSGVGSQVIEPAGRLRVDEVDLSSLDGHAREIRAQQLLQWHTRYEFDLERECAFMVQLVALGDAEHLLIMNMHHILMDGPSVAILFRELDILYNAFTRGEPSPLPDLTAQYADFAIWQRRWLQGAVLENQLSYWRSRLVGASESLDLPVDRVRSPVPSFQGGVVEFDLPLDLVQSVNALARGHDATVFMTLLAAFHALLSRWTGQRDVNIGVPVDGRGHPQAEPLIGFFLNTLVLRADLSDAPTFTELLRQVRTRLLEAYEHRDLPFYHLVAALSPERQSVQQSLFQVLFAYLPESDLRLGDLKLTRVEPLDRTAKFDLALLISDTGPRVTGIFEYASDLFDRTTIERLAGHFATLLQGLVRNPQLPVDRVPLLTVEERRQLVEEWNDTRIAVQQGLCKHQLIEAQVERTPNAPAVIFEGETLTYRALNSRVNRLAHYLRALGVGPDCLVGVCVERSIEMIVGILAIHKAGGAYLPLDPVYPPARLAYMLADSGAAVLLTLAALEQRLPPHAARMVRLDADWPNVEQYPETNPSNQTVPVNLAYCLYTSGSTGNPKGVALQHSSAVAFLEWVCRTFRAEDLERTVFSTSISFDMSIFELFAPLVTGGTVLLVKDALALMEPSAPEAPTLINTVPSAITALVEAKAVPETVRIVNLAGEPLQSELVDGLAVVAPNARIYNLYGPTEYTLYTTYCDVHPHQHVTIGRPVSNTSIYILDADLEPVPIGARGELYISGAGLARGYLKRPELTADKFLPDPFGPPGARMYRTGDLARYLPDRNIDFLGRIDHQVKVRGYRIELGEIESALLRCDGVGSVVVMAREDLPGDRRLVAYIGARDGARPTEQDLRAALQTRLPEYMVPGAFVVLDALPLTPNGKVDRKALPPPASQPARRGAEYVAPRTPTEGLLAAIWADVLKVGSVGIHDDFFALGGHSLLATQLMARIRQTLRAEILLRDIFAAPTVAGLAERVSVGKTVLHEPIPRIGAARPVASFAQERMWFLDQLEPRSGLYNVSVAWRLTGPLHHDALERGLNEIVRRHDVMRTVFAASDGFPIPVVLDHVPFAVPIDDISGTVDPEAEAERLLEDDARHPFDLARGPMVRIKLMKVAHHEHILMITLHHVVADGWSLDVLLSELSVVYGAYSKGQLSPLPDLPIQYVDFAAWQRGRLQGDTLTEHVEYWRRYLDGAPKALDLPSDRPRPAVATYRGGCIEFALDAELSARLRGLSQSHQVTVFMTMAAALNVLLHRYSGQSEICIGYSVGNRDRVEIEGLVGVFVNTLVLRTKLTAHDTFEELLTNVREAMLEADLHKDLPFEKLIEELRPERDLSRHPLFQVAYNYSTTHGSRSRRTTRMPGLGQREVTLPGLDISLVEPEYQSAKFDLSLFVSDTGAEIEGDLEYASDLFDEQTIEGLADHFKCLMSSIVANPSTPIGDLAMLSDAKRRRLLVDFNDTAAPYPSDMTLHGLFERQVERAPDILAVVAGSVEVSYRELNAKANQVARHLRVCGVGPDRLVAVCLTRSVDLVVGLLAILKAGGAYVPLDPTYPVARLDCMLRDSEVDVVLTEASLSSLFRTDAPHVVSIDADWPAMASYSAQNLTPVVVPENLAYCLYTSGSTGMPKAVALQHANAVAFVTWAATAFAAADARRVLGSTPIGFDLSVFELFWPLTTGGTVLLVKDVLQLLDAPIGPTLINGIPSAAQALADARAIGDGVRVMTLAGEPLRAEVADALRAANPGLRIYNLYGPTEYTTYATCTEVLAGEPITIGRPIANTQIYILDEQLEPVPIGVHGDMYIAGAGLSRGYVRRPELTAERFVPNPYGDPGSRMYSTGDRGRYLPEGWIEFLGRRDNQVKVRGYRIELGEIESALRACEGVADTVVVARDNHRGEKALVAYVVVADGGRLSDAEAIASLRARLPEYMVPSGFEWLDAIPRTAHGKVDRQALPAPHEAIGPYADAMPRTPAEELLASIWADVLGVERVGLHTNFFEMGGHSLLATQLVARIRQTMHVDVPLRTLFAAPTIAELNRAIASARNVSQDPIPRAGRDGTVPASFAQQRMWLLDRFEHSPGLYNISTAWRIDGAVDLGALQRSLDAVVDRHESLRTTFGFVEGVPFQIISRSLRIPIGRVDVSSDPERGLRAAVDEHGEWPFDLATGPLVRSDLVTLSDREHVLLLTVHHAIADGWSLDLLIGELCVLYEADVCRQRVRLSDLPIQYADYAVWQRRRLQGDLLQEQLAFWTRYLDGASKALDLPTDHPRPSTPSYRGAWVGFELDAGLTARLRGFCARMQVTPFMVMTTAFAVMLHRLSRQDDVCIGYPLASRDRPELQNVIGLFANMVVMRARFERAQTFGALAAAVRESILEGSAHHDVPFERLVDALCQERDPSRQPLFQAAINYLHAEEPRLSAMKMTRIQAYDRTSKFDLTLFVSDAPELLHGGFEYATDLFDRATVERFIGHLEAILDAGVADPDCRVDALRMLTAAERRHLLVECNDTRVERADRACVHELIERRAAANPAAAAVVSAACEMSYGELNARANQLARYLRGLGVGLEARVAVCAERSVQTIVGLLGILKTGAGYVPLDPRLPATRVASMLAERHVSVVLTEARLEQQHSTLDCIVVRLDADWPLVAQGDPDNLAIPIAPLNLAYCIYTSGSTGVPKGVEVPHVGLSNLVSWHTRVYDLKSGDRVTQAAALSFDAYGWETWSCLAAGATLYIVDDEVRHAPASIPSWLADHGITHCFLPTPVAEAALATRWPANTTLSTLLTGGDTLRRSGSMREGLRLINHYGPTEASVVTTSGEVRASDAPHRRPSIGKPIDNTFVYILDSEGEPVPIGVVGHLYIGGNGLARGYAARPEETAEAFVPNPFSVEPGQRLYCTGDLARYRPDGEIDFVGRVDDQVKINGVRIELGDVEAALSAHAGVRECVVSTKDGPSGQPRLVAYIVPAGGAASDAQVLRKYLKTRIPDAMIPTAFVTIAEVPLLSSGKVDRRALPAPRRWGVREEEGFVAPRTETERALAEIWADRLGSERVGVYDDFFALGGESLLIVQVTSRIRARWGINVPFRAFFDGATVADLAEAIDTARWMAESAPPAVAERVSSHVVGEL